MEPKVSLPRSQGPTKCPSPEIDQVQSMPSKPISLRFSIILSFHPSLVLRIGLFPSCLPTEIHHTSLFSPPQGQQAPRTFFLLDFISLIIFGEEHKSCKSSLYHFLQINFRLDWTILTAMLHEDLQVILYTSGA